MAVQSTETGNTVPHLLAIGAYVLDGGGADLAGNAGQAFDAGQAAFDAEVNKGVPIFAAAGRDPNRVLLCDEADAAQGDVEDQAGKAVIREDGVAAAAQDLDGKGVLSGPDQTGAELVDRLAAGEVTRRATELEGGVGSEEDVFLEDVFYHADLVRFFVAQS